MMNKRNLIPVVAGVVVFGAVTAFAAGFTLTSTSVVAGNVAVTGCNTNAAVSYNTAWDAGMKDYKITTTPVTTTPGAGCHGMAYKVSLTGTGGILPKEVTGTLDVNGATVITLPPDFSSFLIPASSVTGVSVSITG